MNVVTRRRKPSKRYKTCGEEPPSVAGLFWEVKLNKRNVLISVVALLLFLAVIVKTKDLKPLQLTGTATPLDIGQVQLQVELPDVPSELPVYKPLKLHQNEHNFTRPVTYVESLIGEEPTLNKSIQIAREFLLSKGIDTSEDD